MLLALLLPLTLVVVLLLPFSAVGSLAVRTGFCRSMRTLSSPSLLLRGRTAGAGMMGAEEGTAALPASTGASAVARRAEEGRATRVCTRCGDCCCNCGCCCICGC